MRRQSLRGNLARFHLVGSDNAKTFHAPCLFDFKTCAIDPIIQEPFLLTLLPILYLSPGGRVAFMSLSGRTVALQTVLPTWNLWVLLWAVWFRQVLPPPWTPFRAGIIIYSPSYMVTWAEYLGNNDTSSVHWVPVGANTGFGTLCTWSWFVVTTSLQSGCLPHLKKPQLREASERPETGFEHRLSWYKNTCPFISFLVPQRRCANLYSACPFLSPTPWLYRQWPPIGSQFELLEYTNFKFWGH